MWSNTIKSLRDASVFQKLKAALSDRPLLSAPDFTHPFFLDTDASDEGAGAFIYQEDASGQQVL